MALQLKREHACESEDSDSKIVKFVVVERQERAHAHKAELTSFEELMLPHLDAAHNLARWLLRNEQDAQDVVQEAYLRAFKSFAGFHGSNGRAWLLTIVRNTSYTLLKKNRAVDLTTTFDEEIHASGYESVSPATILEHSEDAELLRQAMDELPAELRVRIQSWLREEIAEPPSQNVARDARLLITKKQPGPRSIPFGTSWNWLALAAAIVFAAIIAWNVLPQLQRPGADQFLATQLI